MGDRRAAAGLVLVAVLLIGIAFAPVPMVAVSTADGEPLVCRAVRHGEAVSLVFTHSMYGGDVRETFVVAPDYGLRRTSIVTGNAAAAEYYATDGRIARTADGYRLLVPEQTFDDLVFRIDGIGRHRLLIDGDVIALTDGAGGSRQARLHVVTGTLAGTVLGRLGLTSPC